jgi:hypothetical protein
MTFYSANKARYGFAAAARMIVQTMLQSPAFLYRVEGAGALATAAVVVKATPFELASRLSYLLWSTMPDKALLDAAATGQLATPAAVVAQARRMLMDARAGQGVRNFFGQWLEIPHVDSVTKDATAFPRWSPRIASLMRRETETFVEDVVLRGDATLQSLLRAGYSFADKELATFYGAAGPAGAAFEKVMLDPSRRSGVLTQGALLAALAAPRQTSPVKRGFYVRDRLLCSPPPPAPANVNVMPPEPDPRSTTRERFAQHRTDPGCAGCHALMDPIGLGFESYDAVGLWRDKDAGRAVDASGDVTGTTDADGPFTGAIELSTRLVGSGQVRQCVARQYFRFAYGRGETTLDACTIEALAATLAGAGGGFRELLAGLTQADPFLLRSVELGAAQ